MLLSSIGRGVGKGSSTFYYILFSILVKIPEQQKTPKNPVYLEHLMCMEINPTCNRKKSVLVRVLVGNSELCFSHPVVQTSEQRGDL